MQRELVSIEDYKTKKTVGAFINFVMIIKNKVLSIDDEDVEKNNNIINNALSLYLK